MAVDKLVDSAQLDSDLEDVADAIRAKSGGSSPLAFPAGFVSEIESIQTGGGGLVARTYTGTVIMSDVASTTLIVPVDIRGAFFVDGHYALSKTGTVSNGEVSYDNEITMHQNANVGTIVIAERFTMGSSQYSSSAFKRDETNYGPSRNLNSNSMAFRAAYGSNGDAYSIFRAVSTDNAISFDSGNASTRYCNSGLYCEYAYELTAYFVEE